MRGYRLSGKLQPDFVASGRISMRNERRLYKLNTSLSRSFMCLIFCESYMLAWVSQDRAKLVPAKLIEDLSTFGLGRIFTWQKYVRG